MDILSLLSNRCRFFTGPACALKRELRYNDIASVTKRKRKKEAEKKKQEDEEKKDERTFEPSAILRKFDRMIMYSR